MIRLAFQLVLLLAASLSIAGAAEVSGVITADAKWSGEIVMTGDLYVVEGVSLTIEPGTTVRVKKSESTKTDPEYLSSLTELLVRGRLVAEGTAEKPIAFLPDSDAAEKEHWAGIIIDRGAASFRHCRIESTETGVYAIQSSPAIDSATITKNAYGVISQGESSKPVIINSRISGNAVGIMALDGARPKLVKNTVSGNTDESVYIGRGADAVLEANEITGPAIRKFELPAASISIPVPFGAGRHPASGLEPEVIHSTTIMGDAVWSGRILIDGVVRVPAGVKLTILPGTMVEFAKFDSNADGIGENEIFISGTLLAKGTPDAPIVFTSAEKIKRMGDWGAINMMAADAVPNIVEYCIVEYAYRGLHSHFSMLEANNNILRENMRAVQFQESTVTLRGNLMTGNLSGCRFRDSKVTMTGNRIHGGYVGANIFRTDLELRGNRITGALIDSLRLRECRVRSSGNLIFDNRRGVLVMEAEDGEMSGDLFAFNEESGLKVQRSRLAVRGARMAGNGMNGMSVDAFNGSVSASDFYGNGRYAIGNRGAGDVSAANNWFGDSPDMDRLVFDHADDAKVGRILVEPRSRGRNSSLTFGNAAIAIDSRWRGEVEIYGVVTLRDGAALAIDPGSRVRFAFRDVDGDGAGDAGITVKSGGRITATDAVFGSLEPDARASAWGEIALDHAGESVFSRSAFRHASWGLHLHYTKTDILDCIFAENGGGVRMRSGPVRIKGNSFIGNEIGIRLFHSSPNVTGNLFTGNITAVFCREGCGETRIHGNDFFDNVEYDIKLGDAQTGDLDASGNWWGGSDKNDATGKFFDGLREPYVGRVRTEPHLMKRATKLSDGL
ncbi:MAG: right-handed parallel beta-helix repeat-containing protein [Nitrospirae bacterium]|nr:right-handed parallel beta-helix repeat-containing protein [Nitrospirota bacterium]